MQAVQKGDPSLRAHYMAALGEWLVQQGTAKEAGKEVLLGAAALLEPPAPATPKGTLKGDHSQHLTCWHPIGHLCETAFSQKKR